MQEGLVSVITPCYNTAQYVSRLLDSILSQTYPFMEMIVVDDGSTDGSAEIVHGYIPRFEQRGYRLFCIRQENSGQSVAIQTALTKVQGEFLVWPDSDDYYASEHSIEKMVKALQEASSEFAMVRVQEQMVTDDKIKRVLHVAGLGRDYEEEFSLFEDCLYAKNGYYFCPGGYMVRMKALMETTHLDIYTVKDAGQNWQLMLPVLYKYRCLTIPEVLYTVVSREASHSRGQFAGYDKTIHKLQVYEDTIQGTLDRMQMENAIKAEYKKRIELKYLYEKLLLDYRYLKQNAFFERYKSIKQCDGDAIGLLEKLLYVTVLMRVNSVPLLKKIILRLYHKLHNDKYQR